MGSKTPSNSDTKSPPRPTVTPRFSRSMVCGTLIRIFEMFLSISLAFYKAHLWFHHPFREFDLTGHSESNVHWSFNSLWNHEMTKWMLASAYFVWTCASMSLRLCKVSMPMTLKWQHLANGIELGWICFGCTRSAQNHSKGNQWNHRNC